MTRFLAISLASFALGACSQSSDFSGGSKRTAAEQAACDAKTETIAELVTPQVKNGDPNNLIKYQISVANCDGDKLKLETKYILFDVNGITDRAGNGKPLPYIATAGSTEIEGEIEEIAGSDLFGNKGDGYFHNRTDKVLTLPEGTTEVSFVIKLEGASYKPQEGNASADNLLPTYLGFGEAKVVRTDVHFLGLYPTSALLGE